MAYQQGPPSPYYGPPPGYGYPPPGYGHPPPGYDPPPPPPPPPPHGRSPLFWLFAAGLPLVVLASCTAALITVGTPLLDPAPRQPAPAPLPTIAEQPASPIQPFTPAPAATTQPPGGAVTQPSGGPVTQPSNGPVTQPPGGPVTQPSDGPVTQPPGGPVTQPTRRTQAGGGTVLATEAGTGAKNTRQFTVDATWEIRYTYDCAEFPGGHGNIIVSLMGRDGPVDIPVTAAGPNGRDTAPQYRAGTFHLSVVSPCEWTLEVADI
ncbi:hypothetical protein [Sphaerisporangium aureirubrum]|uniref:Uncharacterized protein n=1 Tax=Sphaerisporangium aureirubrum TaxID=1544736 RepID=A0ABW1NAE2_9ACTN